MATPVKLEHRLTHFTQLIKTSLTTGEAVQFKEAKMASLYCGTGGVTLAGDDGDSAKTSFLFKGTSANISTDQLIKVQDSAATPLFYVRNDGDAYLLKNFTTGGDLQINGVGTSTMAGNLTVSGNLQVDGTTTTVNTSQLNVADNIIRLANLQVGASPSIDGGISVERGDLNNTICMFDESADEWVFGYTLDETGTTVALSARADMRALAGNFEGGLTLTNTGITMTGLDVGSAVARAGTIYCTTIDATTITGSVASNGTTAEQWFINSDAAATDVGNVTLRYGAGRGAGGTTIQEFRWTMDHAANGAAGAYEGNLTLGYANDNTGAFTTLITANGADNSATFAGNVNATLGLDVSGAALTISNQAITQTTGGQVTFAGNVNADLGLDITGGPFTFTGTAGSWTAALSDSALTQTGTGLVTLTGNVDATLGLDVSGAPLTFTGTAGSWTFALSDSALTQTGTGLVTLTGNVDATLGLDVSGAPLTIANQAITQTTGGQVTFAGNVNADGGLDVTGLLSSTGGAISFTPTGTFALSMAAAQTAIITVADNLANTFQVKEGANSYLAVDTTNTSETVSFGNTTTNPAYSFLGSGTVSISGLTNSLAGITVSGGAMTMNGTNVALNPTGTYSLSMDAAQAASISLSDNLASSFLIDDGTVAYFDITTTNSSEKVSFGNATTNPSYEFLGTGGITFGGDITVATADVKALSNSYTNNTGAQIDLYSCVYISGDNEITECDADTDVASEFLGVTMANIANLASGEVAYSGSEVTVKKSTSEAWAAGDNIYLSTVTGEATNVPPSTAGTYVKRIGFTPAAVLAATASAAIVVQVYDKVLNQN